MAPDLATFNVSAQLPCLLGIQRAGLLFLAGNSTRQPVVPLCRLALATLHRPRRAVRIHCRSLGRGLRTASRAMGYD